MATIRELAEKGTRKIRRPEYPGNEHLVLHVTRRAEMRDICIAPYAKLFNSEGKDANYTRMVHGNQDTDWEEFEPREMGMVQV